MKKISHIAHSVKELGFRRIVLIVAGVWFVAASLFVIWAATWKLPTLDSFSERYVPESTKIYDRTGEVVLYDVFQNIKRTVVPFDNISPNIKNATVAIEDDQFYSHFGVRPLSFLRAIFVNLLHLKFDQGGSTITQQVIKNSVLTNEKTITRKIKEWVLAIRLERMLSKDEILNLYLNEIPYGGSLYGVEEASLAFFGKHAKDLELAESAYLAALPQAPTYYSPYGSHKDALDARKNTVLQKMLDNKYITKDQFDEARAEQVTFLPQSNSSIKAPHFVMYIREYLAEKYGEEAVQSGGFKVITTLDYSIQSKAEEIAKKFALQNEKTYNASNDAFIVIDPKTGQILSMVGSRDYFDTQIDGNYNVAVDGRRQPGSTMKPFAYATAFNKGFTPDTMLFDVPIEFNASCNPDGTAPDGVDPSTCYMPHNYDSIFRGPVSMRNAMAQSINVPSVQTLYLAGLTDTLRLARDMGVTSLKDPSRYGLTLVLGGGEVSLLEMTSAYGAFATGGLREPATGILEVEDRNGNVLEQFQPEESRVLPEETTLEISDVLSDNNARAPAFGASSYLFIPDHDVAVKTGTTNDYRDAWIIGYTPGIVVGAWAGNNDNTPMEKKVAGFIVAPMWRALMDEILAKIPDEHFKDPIYDYSGLKPVLRGVWQGGISNGSTPTPPTISDSTDLFNPQTPPAPQNNEVVSGGVHSILYWVNKDDPRGPAPSNPNQDPQFKNWESSVRAWAIANGYAEDSDYLNSTSNRNSGTSNSNTSITPPSISFKNPDPQKIYSPQVKIVTRIEYQGDNNLDKIDYYFNGKLIGSTNSITFTFTPSDYEYTDTNTLKAVATDKAGLQTENWIVVHVKVPQT